MNKFNGVMGAKPAEWKPSKPSAERIAATGRALGEGTHTLTGAQQRAWFGGVVFDGPVRWDGAAFVSGGQRLTPEQVARAAQ